MHQSEKSGTFLDLSPWTSHSYRTFSQFNAQSEFGGYLLFFESNKSELCLGRNGREKEGKRPIPNFRKLSIRRENACEIAILVKIVTVHLSLRISQELLKLPRSPLFSKTLGIMPGKIGYGINWCVSFRRALWTR